MSKRSIKTITKNEVIDLYKKLLGRDPDKVGLENYMNSGLSVNEIEEDIKKSEEYSTKHGGFSEPPALETNIKKVDLLSMGTTPRVPSHIDTLIKAGVKHALCLDEGVPYATDWCSSFLHVPLNLDKTISKDDLLKCVDFIYDIVVNKEERLFVHSLNGRERAPMILSLFMYIVNKTSLYNSILGVSARRNTVNPRRGLINADLLGYAKSLRGRYSRKGRIERECSVSGAPLTDKNSVLKAADDVFVGSSCGKKVQGHLYKEGIKTILDLCMKKTPLDFEYHTKFFHIHVPLDESKFKEVFPVLKRVLDKHRKRGSVYLFCDRVPLLLMFLENYIMNTDDKSLVGSMDLAKIRKSILGTA